MLPKDMPPWASVYDHYRRLRDRGVWDQIMFDLNKKFRLSSGKNPNPSYAIIDTQSIKTQYSGEKCGYDGGKKVKGRKRHVCVDTMGNLLHIKVHSAGIHDTIAGPNVAYQSFRKHSSIRAFCADMGYRGTTTDFIENDLKMRVDITSKDKLKPGFHVIKTRWVVERFFAWIGNFRRFSKDFERSTRNSEQLIVIASIMMLLNRLF